MLPPPPAREPGKSLGPDVACLDARLQTLLPESYWTSLPDYQRDPGLTLTSLLKSFGRWVSLADRDSRDRPQRSCLPPTFMYSKQRRPPVGLRF